jgi:hypothetical protein
MRAQEFSDKSGPCNGCLKDGIIKVWRKDIPKSEFSFALTVSGAKRAFSFGDTNWVLFTIANEGLCRAFDNWIENTSDEVLRQKRRYAWENDDLYGRDSCAFARTVDSAVRVIRALLDKE